MNIATDTRPRNSQTVRPATETKPHDEPVIGGEVTDTPVHAPKRFGLGRTAGLVVAAVAVGALAWNVFGDSTTSTVDDATVRSGQSTTAQVMIQESIDDALAERNTGPTGLYTTAQEMIQHSIDDAFVARATGPTSLYTTAQVMVQESIDESLAERVSGPTSLYTTAQEMIQASIDDALAGRNGSAE